MAAFFIITHQQFTETVEKGVGDLNNPAAGMEIRIVFQFFIFLSLPLDSSSVRKTCGDCKVERLELDIDEPADN